MSDAAPDNALPQTVAVLLAGSTLQPEMAIKILGVRVRQGRSMASHAEIRFEDENFDVIDDSRFAIGKEIEIKFVNYRGTATTAFKGEITALGTEQRHGLTHEFVVEAHDRSHRLGHTSRVRTFLKMTYDDMVAKIAGESGLQADSSLGQTKFDYTMQNSTDFAFLDMIAWRTGTEWAVDDKTLKFKKRAAGTELTLTLGENLRRFRARYSGTEHVAKSTVRSWDPLTKKAITAEDTQSVSDPPTSGDALLVSNGRTAAKKSFDKTAFATGAAVAETLAEAKAVAAALGARQATSELIVKGEALGATTMVAGAIVKISNVGKNMSGKYYLTEVEHVFGRNGDLVTRFTAGGHEPSALVDLLGGGGGDVGPWGKEGLVVGIVTNNKDPDGLSRVKVKFPTLSDSEESNWARLVSIGAGNKRGWHMIPEIDDEVVVGFEHGDLRRPYVLGAVWNSKDKPPTENSETVVNDKVSSWTIKTRQGLVLGLLDGEEPEKKAMSLVLSDGKTKLLVSETKIQVITDKKPIELNTGEASIVMDDRGDITIKGNNITIEGKQNVKIEAKSNFDAKGLQMKLEAQTSFEAKGTATAKVEASGQLALKGAIVQIN